MTLHFRISFRKVVRSCGRAEVSTTVVVTFSGVPMLGGMVICGRTDWILLLMNWSLTSEAMRLDFPVPSSPQTQMRTVKIWRQFSGLWGKPDSRCVSGGLGGKCTCGHDERCNRREMDKEYDSRTLVYVMSMTFHQKSNKCTGR